MKARRVEGKRAAMPAAAQKRKPAAKPGARKAKPKPKSRARRSSAGRFGLPHLEQRHFDLIGLACVAVAVFLGFVLYRGRDGGEAGRRMVDGLTWLVGDVAYAAPVGLFAIGAILVLRPVPPTSCATPRSKASPTLPPSPSPR